MNKEEPKFEPIPMWRWILLFFCPVHKGYDEEGGIACVIFAKILLSLFILCEKIIFVKQQAIY